MEQEEPVTSNSVDSVWKQLLCGIIKQFFSARLIPGWVTSIAQKNKDGSVMKLNCCETSQFIEKKHFFDWPVH